MDLDIQNGALGAGNEHFKKNWAQQSFFYELKHQRKSDGGCTDLQPKPRATPTHPIHPRIAEW